MICVVDTTCDVESGLSQHSVHQSSPGLSRNQIFLSKIKQFHGRGETGQMPVSSNVMTAHRPLVVIRKFANGNAQKLWLGFDLRKQRRRQKHTKTIKNQSHNSCVKQLRFMSRLRKKELTSSSYMSHCESTKRPPKNFNPRHTALESNVCDFCLGASKNSFKSDHVYL